MNAHVDLSPGRHPEFELFITPERSRARVAGRFDGALRAHATEVPWRHPSSHPSPSSEVLITRWRRSDTPIHAVGVRHDDHALLAIAIASTHATIRVDDAIAHDGRVSPGTFHLVAPGHSLDATFTKPADFVRLYIPRQIFFALIDGTAFARMAPQQMARLTHDHVVEQLALGIINATADDHPVGRHFLDGLGTALLARAGAVLATKHTNGVVREGLISWRLKRVVDFIERNLDSPLALADLARAAGLSRMHFAAQFRLATGFRPHAYLTRRRIERAQELLRDTTMPLVEIALNVGFQTQAHFTTIFRQIAGKPPGQWRHCEAALAEQTRPAGFGR